MADSLAPTALRVPEAGYVLHPEEGLIPRTLRPLLARREALKAHLRSTQDPRKAAIYEARKEALKWILVTCFGYLGYRNARFGRIEAHEAVTAWGREWLLQAKECAEARGFHVYHGLSDSLWLGHPVLRGADLAAEGERLAEEITRRTGIRMSVEGVYRWICFLPSRQHPEIAVPQRFWGVFLDGRLKVRGLLVRRHDTPPFVARVQARALEYLRQFRTLEEARAKRAEVEAFFREAEERLQEGRVPLEELAIRRRVTRELEAYRAKTPVSVALWKLRCAGIRVHPGEVIRVVLVPGERAEERSLPLELCAPDTPYDVARYREWLERAREEVLIYALSGPRRPGAPPEDLSAGETEEA